MKTLEQKIEVMQAELEGKEIEVKERNIINDSWDYEGKANWNWVECDYRIKPAPMEFWVNLYVSHREEVYTDEEDAKRELLGANGKTIKVREVLDD